MSFYMNIQIRFIHNNPKLQTTPDRLPTPVLLGFPCVSAGKESACKAGDLGSIHGLGRSPGEGEGNPFQYSGLENSMDCIVHGVTKSWTQQSNFHFTWSTFGHGRVKVKISVTQLCLTLCNPMDCSPLALQDPLSMGFSRQEYWTGLPFPSLGDFLYPGTEPTSPSLQADSLSSEPPGRVQ